MDEFLEEFKIRILKNSISKVQYYNKNHYIKIQDKRTENSDNDYISCKSYTLYSYNTKICTIEYYYKLDVYFEWYSDINVKLSSNKKHYTATTIKYLYHFLDALMHFVKRIAKVQQK